ncbi:sulfotransferase domain-containing protein [Zunongwangia sp. SCSIO 43204]|uniref:sulfotransferase domain-containing protein n=1 Tax=Zunongwangia sp. SCSIO 43204 TaxID=2779359 RepID=UPI001CA92201|nr:sulfotransferase domain-containing protein [Zunongwangia sp. SCSIO 43204]UAB86162.1 sulfotransferase domain-containing protein [Zunongwangia sp. SCSIO 43204]
MNIINSLKKSVKNYNIRKDPFKYFRLIKENILYPGSFMFDFVVIGVQKAGTSALDKYLRDHTKLAMPIWKEISYFNNDKGFINNNLPNPRAFYRIKNRMKMYGEITPCYIYSPYAVERMKKHNPQMKIIVMLRNPIDRAFSQYNMETWRNWEKRSFLECIMKEIEEIKAGTKKYHMVRSYVHRGMYVEQIERVLKSFPNEQVLFLKYEDFRKDQKSSLQHIYHFLGVNEIPFNQEKTANKISYSSKMGEPEKDILRNFFLPTILEVEKRLSWDCSDWKE